MRGDALASGARSATFGPAKSVSQEKWDQIFGPPEVKTKPPVAETEVRNGQLICRTHPAYRGRISPRAKCAGCQKVYEVARALRAGRK